MILHVKPSACLTAVQGGLLLAMSDNTPDQTSRSTTRAHSQICHRGRTRKADVVPLAQVRTSTTGGSALAVREAHHPRYKGVLRVRLERPIPIRLQWEADTCAGCVRSATRNKPPHHTS